MKTITEPETNKDTFEILITTDNHMGFREKDPVVGEDSFISFEECLEVANRRNVDFVLLGGDLFHDQRPSQKAQLQASQIFNRHVFATSFNDCTMDSIAIRPKTDTRSR